MAQKIPFWIKGNSLHFLNNNKKEEKMTGLETGGHGDPGYVWFSKKSIHYTDQNKKERCLNIQEINKSVLSVGKSWIQSGGDNIKYTGSGSTILLEEESRYANYTNRRGCCTSHCE